MVAATATGSTTQSHLAKNKVGRQGRNETRRARSTQPRVAPRRNLGDAAIFRPAVSELLLADALTKLVVARNRSSRALDRTQGGVTKLAGLNCDKSPRSCFTRAPGAIPAVSWRGRVPDMSGDVPHPVRGHMHHPRLIHGTMNLAFITNSKNSLAMAERYHA